MVHARNLDEFSIDSSACVVAIGVFDALHRGHLKVIESAKELASKLDAKVYVLTFFPHPSKVLSKEKKSQLIYGLDTRLKLLWSLGVDCIFVKDFTADFAALSPDEFLLYIMRKFPNLKGIVTGDNFRFGKNAGADTDWLAAKSEDFGFKSIAVKGEIDDDMYVSSTRLRRLLGEGRMEEFARLCSRPYFAMGKVVPGKHLGAKLGFPTLNLNLSGECLPPFGVYVSRLENLDTGISYKGVSNYGNCPSVGGGVAAVLETNLFSDSINFGKGTPIKVELLKFLRGERKFPNLDELKNQINIDKNEALAYFSCL